MRQQMEFVGPLRQTIWGWPAVLNFYFGGIGSLFYLGTFLPWSVVDGAASTDSLHMVRLIGPLLTALGFLAVVSEAGRPSRAWFLLHNLRTSWMSREVLAGGVFIGCALGFAILPLPFFKWLALAGALALVICQVMMLYDGRGVTLWYRPIVPLQSFLGNMVAGAALLMMVLPSATPASLHLMLLSAFVLLADGWAWHRLLRHPKTDMAGSAVTPLLQTGFLTLTIGVGHLMPVLLLLTTIVVSLTKGNEALLHILTLEAAGLILVGVLSQKAGLVLVGNCLRPMQRSREFLWQGE